MRDALPVIGAIACCAALSACTTAGAKHAPGDGSVHQLHQAFISAINTNNADAILALCTEDVVFLPPHEPAVVGKAAARQWLDAYLNTYTTRQEETSNELIVSGDWAFQRISYKETDTPKAGGPAVVDTGKGLDVFHRGKDGKWRVARDAWNSDLPVPGR